MDHTDPSHASGTPAGAHGQQHPIGIYLKIWGLMRWTLIIVLMIAKAGLIVSVFMHMMWERLALVYAILIPPLCLLVLMLLMAAEAHHTFGMRELFFR
jgi:cytochrome c oxidase subunit IV